MQVTAYGLPLYTFSGDTAAGETNGQGVGGDLVGGRCRRSQDRRGEAGSSSSSTEARRIRPAATRRARVEGVDGPAQPRVDVLDRDSQHPPSGRVGCVPCEPTQPIDFGGGRHRIVFEIEQRAEQGPREVATGCAAPPPAVPAAARPRPREQGQRLTRVEPRGPDFAHSERSDRTCGISLDSEYPRPAFGAGGPRTDERACRVDDLGIVDERPRRRKRQRTPRGGSGAGASTRAA